MSPKPIKKILVANRGEIAIRIFRACSELGISTVALYTFEDRFSLHRYKADEAYEIGEKGNPVGSYLRIDEIIRIAKNAGVDAIHPGYGFLSERAEFREAAVRAGIRFIGPDTNTLTIAGDKVKTLALARSLKIPTVSGSKKLNSVDDAKRFAKKNGYPLILKASFGGGGRGMRVVRTQAELITGFAGASAEAKAAFGKPDLYLEKYVNHPRHIEVQLIGDGTGEVMHLFERDCSVQRRHQKVVEIAPATTLPAATRSALYTYALALGKALTLTGVSTAEFLVDNANNIYFIEINPRIQVEHTVTEEITGIDIVQSQIRIAEGATLKSLNITPKHLHAQGVAIQCRVTTEDPAHGFAPDSGKLSAYRSASGFGIRLDAGSAFTGAVITPFYDSLLVKVTARGRTIDDASRKLRRCLSEFRIRGVKTNLQFLDALLSHTDFLKGEITTSFIEENPSLTQFAPKKDRANKILRFIADTTVNGHELMPGLVRPRSIPTARIPPLPTTSITTPLKGWRTILKEEGKESFLNRIRESKELLITDTTLRDAHQSLLATRLRTYDMTQVAEALSAHASSLFSLEMWGGATFDVALRFLHEDPWERLALLREKIPSIPFQMLVRGANVVGYKNYPNNVIRSFIKESVATGIDIIRIFDCFNNLETMRSTIDATRAEGAVAEVCLCYTSDLLEEEKKGKKLSRNRYDLKYYLTLAKEIAKAGADILAIKDMAGLLRPYSAQRLISALKEEIDLPIHLHTHDTAGGQLGTYLKAAESGVHIVDCAFSSMSGVTSQPALEGLVAALENTPRQSKLSLDALTPFSDYWESVRSIYAPFESDLKSATGEVYITEIPGGQYSNFRPQAASVGLGHRWPEVKKAYTEANELLGNIIKVTPSSKVVGDLALFMVSQNLTRGSLVARASELDFPASVIELFRGEMGFPQGGFPKDLQKAILRGAKPQTTSFILPPADFEEAEKIVASLLGEKNVSSRAVLSYLLYPAVFKEYAASLRDFGTVSSLPSTTFLYGLKENEEISVDLEAGKRLFISLSTISEPGENGERTVFFELNGQTRTVSVRDKKVTSKVMVHEKIESTNPHQIGAPLSGALVKIEVAPGASVKKDTPLFTVEAMKMQTIVRAPRDGKVIRIPLAVGSKVEGGDLIVEFAAPLAKEGK